MDVDTPLVGRTIERVESQGKHLLMSFSGDLVLRTHMRMSGSWHIYRPDERWQRPPRDMRVLVATETFVAVGFNIPVAEFETTHTLQRAESLGGLGPDLLSPAFDAADAHRRIRRHPLEAIGPVLLNQRIVAGIGNVFKSETLFLCGIHPFTPVGRLTDDQLANVLETGRRLLGANVLPTSKEGITTLLRLARTIGGRRPLRSTVGVWARESALPSLRHVHRRAETRPRRPHHLLVSPLSATASRGCQNLTIPDIAASVG